MGRLASSVLLLLFLVAPAGAQPGSYSIQSFKASFQVNPDSSLGVQETIIFDFRGSHQGIYRTIPIRYERYGFSYDLRVDGIQVLDDRGGPLRTEVSYPGRYVKIKAWVPGAQAAARTVTIIYTVYRGLLALDDHDELYWNVTGNEWAVPIREAEAIVGLPKSVPAESVRTLAFTGPFGAAGKDYTLDRAENFLVFRTARPLGIREGLTVVVGWPTGHVRFPSRAQRLGWFLSDQRWFILPLLVFAGCFLAWGRLGRDPLSGESVKVEYEPPAALRPGEAGTLVDETVHPRDVVATVVDLAVRGHLHIKQVPATALLGEPDYLFTLPKPWLGEPDIAPFEVIVLAQVFGAGGVTNTKLLSEVRRDSKAIFPPIRDQIYRDLVEKKYFLASPQSVRRFWSTIGGLLLAAPLALWSTWGGGFPGDSLSLSMLLALALSALIVLAFARVMPRKTFRGARAKLQVRGFQEFLERAEKDRLQRLPPETLHKWLPYAIALGVDEAWISNFEGIAVSAPAWYESKEPFTVSGFWRSVRAFDRNAQEAWLTAGRGRGGSTWGGGGSGFSGGSSGGGGGGGGGGTF
ncbi:MAG: DUF2207 domain-containing protein [Candidatus Rokubacteria bacterium]|nr:DUF2207 domain-containing protein [Candidatus Rokubacteria bacterium]